MYTQESPAPFELEGCRKEFPLHVLPLNVRNLITNISAAVETDPAVAALVALGTTAAATRGNIKVSAIEGWEEPENEYFAAVLPSGEGKSPVFRLITAPLFAIEAEMMEKARKRIAKREAERAEIKEWISRLKAKLRREDVDDVAELSAELKAAFEELRRKPEIRLPRLIASDATPEAMARLAAQNGGSIALVSAESPLFETVSGKRYGSTPNPTFLCSAHSGEPVVIDRAGREPERIPEAHATICVAVQPVVMRDARRSEELERRGLIGRFLFVFPVSKVGFRSRHLVGVDPLTIELWSKLVREVFARSSKRTVLRLDPAAESLFVKWRESIEPERRAGGALDRIREWGGKAEAHCLRLCGHLALLRGEEEITVAVLADAISVFEFFQAHILAMYSGLQMTDFDRAVHKSKQVILDQSLSQIPIRDLQRKLGSPKSEFSPVIKELRKQQWCRVVELKKAGPGRTSRVLEINPRVHELNGRTDRNDRNRVSSILSDDSEPDGDE